MAKERGVCLRCHGAFFRMNFRLLGDISCSVLGLGTGKLASLGTGLTMAERWRVFETAAECGINLIDTADSYAQGDCERFLGQALRGRRARFLVATKAGFHFANLGGFARLLKPFARTLVRTLRRGRAMAAGARRQALRMNVRSQDFSTLETALEASLRRLRTEYVDLFFLHDPPVEVLRDERVLGALNTLLRAGKARRIGVSSEDPVVLAAALEMPALHAVQTPVNPCVREEMDAVLAGIAARGIAIIGNHITLSGRLLAPPVGELDEWVAVRAELQRQADADGGSVSRLLHRFALAQPGVTAILTGTTNAGHLRQNAADVLAPPPLGAEPHAAIRAAIRAAK
jgi:aryl-alcohol dehydrogenase-like predicted oxidoreductase